MADVYRSKEWRQFREAVWSLHDYRCLRCGRGRSEGAILQLHHLKYTAGAKPWEYSYEECETLCKGCHAKEHGKIMPDSDWNYEGDDDLEGLYGECDWCGRSLRYVYAISHPVWGTLEVGELCCDHLTMSAVASEQAKIRKARAAFVSPDKWKVIVSDLTRSSSGHQVTITTFEDRFGIMIDGVKGRLIFEDEVQAKLHAFKCLNDESVLAFVAQRRRDGIRAL